MPNTADQLAELESAAVIARNELAVSLGAALKKFQESTGTIVTGIDVTILSHREMGVGITGSLLSNVTVEAAYRGIAVTV